MIRRIFGSLVAIGLFVITAPMALIYLAGSLFVGTFAGFMGFVILRALVFDVPMTRDPSTIFGWVFFAFCFLVAWSVMIWGWALSYGFNLLAPGNRTSHGSARFATKAERAAFQKEAGLLIGRDRQTGKLLRYDGPAHLLTLAPHGQAKASAP